MLEKALLLEWSTGDKNKYTTNVNILVQTLYSFHCPFPFVHATEIDLEPYIMSDILRRFPL